MPWYVIQVVGGQEQALAATIASVAPEGLLQECFCPLYATQIKLRGQWVNTARPLYPGYLVAVTDRPAELARALAPLPEYARVLTVGGEYTPLAREEVDLIAHFTQPGERVIPMSRAVKQGERVVIVDGPLLGHEGFITDIDRHKSVAHLRLTFGGAVGRATVGLAVLASAEGAHDPLVMDLKAAGVAAGA